MGQPGVTQLRASAARHDGEKEIGRVFAVREPRCGGSATLDVADRFWGIMKHLTTQALFDYWTRKRGRRHVSARSDIDPADIRRILAETFNLTADFVNEIRVRLADTRICALFAPRSKAKPSKI